MSIAYYYVKQQLIDQGPVPHAPHSLAYFCQSCGDVWARIIVDTAPIFDVISRCCLRHIPQSGSSWGAVPGTLCQGAADWISTQSAAAALENLPWSVLTREFTLLYEHAFSRNQDEQS